jgi:hypothetical protein
MAPLRASLAVDGSCGAHSGTFITGVMSASACTMGPAASAPPSPSGEAIATISPPPSGSSSDAASALLSGDLFLHPPSTTAAAASIASATR